MTETVPNPAEAAARDALAAVFEALDNRQCFRLEAGAGAGKTYSLVKALRHLIETRGVEFLRRDQRVACITYTNVASEEIASRIDRNPAVLSSTIHAFCWSLIRPFQAAMRDALPKLPKWQERIAEQGDPAGRRIEYELGYPKIGDEVVSLGHNDVITLAIELLANEKFRHIFASRFPVLLIDEYQDTNKGFAESIIEYFVSTGKGPLIGFFGDHWQKIYGDGCGGIDHEKLKVVGKGANFRSVPAIVEVLNRMRPELTQVVPDPNRLGSAVVYHTNGWPGTRRTDGHWKGDLPADAAHEGLAALRRTLTAEGWTFSPDQTKILMLTHNILAREQGYSGIVEALDGRSERFIKKEDPYIKFLVDSVEPMCLAFEEKRFGEMFALLGRRAMAISSHDDKKRWTDEMAALCALRLAGDIGSVLDHVKLTRRLQVPDEVEIREELLTRNAEELTVDEVERAERYRKLRLVRFSEVIDLARFIEDRTPFSTKHGVKGAEFENVLVVIGRGWNMYDFNQMLELAGSGVPTAKRDTYERNRNLFYVACSRPKTRLALYFTQKLSETALDTLEKWFGASNVRCDPGLSQHG